MGQELEPEKNDRRSLAVLVTAMFIFGTIGIFRKYIPLSSGMLAFVRGFLGAAVLILILMIKSVKDGNGLTGGIRKLITDAGWKKIAILSAMGCGIGINWMLLFESYNYTTVSIATLCYYMEPTIVILCSPIIFRERLTGKKLICAGIAILGMFLVSGVFDGMVGSLAGVSDDAEMVAGTGGGGNFKGILFGLAAALLYAIEVMLNKKASNVDPMLLTTVELIFASAVMIPYLLVFEDFGAIKIDGWVVLLLLIVGIVNTGISYVMYFGSMKKLKAQTIALFSYIDPITALILSALILHEHMSIAGMAGAVMILGSAIAGELVSNKS